MTTARHLVLGASLLLGTGCRYLVAREILPRNGVRPPTYRVEVERGLTVRTDDGIVLSSDVYHPVTRERAPTILVRLPFANSRINRAAADVVGDFWASRGYHVVIQGTRGRFHSGGKYYPLMHEREDGLATLAWTSRQPWFDGRLGMWGGSVFGHTQWVLADQANPGPSALLIQIASTDFYDMFYAGGAFSLESALFWAMRSSREDDAVPKQETLARGYDGLPLLEADDRAGRDVDFFNDWVLHSTRDAYWRRISGENRARTLKAPTLLMAGWYDPFLPAQLEDYRLIKAEAAPRVSAETRLIVGPWSHANTVTLPGGVKPLTYRRESLAPTIAWFDRHLKGDSTASEFPPVRIYVMGTNLWRDEQEWPLARAVYKPFYLQSRGNANTASGDGALTDSRRTDSGQADRFVYDPRDPIPSVGGAMLGPRAGPSDQRGVEARRDVLVYTTPPLDRDLEVTGPITLVLHVSTTAPGTDFTAKLVDVHPDGSAYNLSEGILRRRYEANTPTEIRIQMWPTSNVFRRGHRIRLDISSSSYPRFDRNPNTGRDVATETLTQSATQTVFHDSARPSRVILPLIPPLPQ
jgi:uncharacterized protein